MGKIVCFVFVAGMMILFIKDNPITKKIWAAAAAAISFSAIGYMMYVYILYNKKLKSVTMETDMRLRWTQDYNSYCICIIVLLAVAAAVIVYGYRKNTRTKSEKDIDSFIEYLIIGISMVVAVLIYIVGTSFALTHISKNFDVSYFSTAFSFMANAIILVNTLLYMKIMQ